MIPVFTSSGFARFVTGRQPAAEIAGKVLRPVPGLYRTAERKAAPVIGEYWLAFYFTPKEEMVKEWEERRPRDSSTGLPLPARAMQHNIAH